jgi:hypothetical protein
VRKPEKLQREFKGAVERREVRYREEGRGRRLEKTDGLC